MSETRFSWSRVDKISGALELQKRASEDPGCKRHLSKDSRHDCLICKRHPKRGDLCYYPAAGVSSTNKTIGHAECIDRVCEEFKTKQGLTKNNSVVAIAPQPAANSSFTPSVHATPTAPSYHIGWRAGVLCAFEKRQEEARLNDAEWLRGFYEGTTFAIEHKST